MTFEFNNIKSFIQFQSNQIFQNDDAFVHDFQSRRLNREKFNDKKRHLNRIFNFVFSNNVKVMNDECVRISNVVVKIVIETFDLNIVSFVFVFQNRIDDAKNMWMLDFLNENLFHNQQQKNDYWIKITQFQFKLKIHFANNLFSNCKKLTFEIQSYFKKISIVSFNYQLMFIFENREISYEIFKRLFEKNFNVKIAQFEIIMKNASIFRKWN